MNIALYGATGMIGSRLVKEALDRGHSVTALARNPEKLELKQAQLKALQGDATDAADVAAKVAGHDAVIAAIAPGAPVQYPKAAQALMQGCKKAGVLRLIWVGGAGSLEASPGVKLFDTDAFPKDWLPLAKAQYECLELLRKETELEWTYASPAAHIEPGVRKGKFKLGGDQLVKDAKGESRISAEDFAYAVIYQAEKRGKIRQRFTAAYQEA